MKPDSKAGRTIRPATSEGSMAHVNLDAVRTGMVLEADVTNSGGHTLMRAGTQLSARHLTLLRAHGITAVSACEALAEPEMEALPNAPDNCCVVERFLHNNPHHPLISELMRLCEAREAVASTVAAGR